MDHGLASRSNTDPLNLDAEEALDELDVLPTRFRQLLKGSCLGNVALPAGEGLVLHLHLGQHLKVGREAGKLLAVDEVADADLDLLQVVEYVELGDVEARVAVDEARVLHHHQVEPTASTPAARSDTVLGTDLLEVVSNIVEQLGGERSHADTGGVGLHDPNHITDSGRRDAETSADTTDRSGRACDEGVGTKVNVEHESVGTLDEHASVVGQRSVDEGDTIDNVRAQSLGKGTVTSNLAFRVVLKVSVALEAALDKLAELGRKQLRVVEVVNTQTGARGLGRVGRTDALLGGANAAASQLDLLESVDDLVEVEHEVGSVRNEEATVAVQTLLFERVELGEERRNMDDNARADEARATGVDQTWVWWKVTIVSDTVTSFRVESKRLKLILPQVFGRRAGEKEREMERRSHAGKER